MCWRVWWSPGVIQVAGGQALGVAAGLDTGPQVQRDPGLASEGVLRLCTLLSLPPSSPDLNPLDYIVWSYVKEQSPTWPPTTPKPAWSQPSAEYSPSSRRRYWEKHAPSDGSVSRRWLRLKAATLNRCQLYYIIMLPELIFFNKIFGNKTVLLFSLGRQFYRSTLLLFLQAFRWRKS